MVTGPDLRAGDADREAAAATLREHYAQGRLSLEEFNERLDGAFAATTVSQLSQLTRDLPHHDTPAARQTAPAGPLVVSDQGWSHDHGTRGSRQHTGASAGGGVLPTLIAILVSLFVLLPIITPHLGAHFPWPGRLGILLAIFTIVRGLLRRIFRGRR